MNRTSIGPSRWFYALAVLVVIVGSVSFAIVVFRGLGDLGDELTQIVVPGTHQLLLDKAGQYTIFHEYRATIEGRVYSGGDGLPGVQFSLQSQDGSEISLRNPSASASYTIGGRSGRSILEFEIDRPGAYELSVIYPEEQDGSEAVLAIGHGFMSKLMKTIGIGIVTMFGSLAVATAIAVTTFVKRGQAKQTLGVFDGQVR